VIDRCVDSGGLWFDAGELEQLLEAAKGASSASLKDLLTLVPGLNPGAHVTGGKPSPVTGKPMNQDTVMGVAFDRCPESGGVWFDALELKRLIDSSHHSLSSGVKDFFMMVLGR
jgi:Zn-finger nucleic acid-binding protein